MSRPCRAMMMAALVSFLAGGSPWPAAATDRPSVVVDLSVLDTLNPADTPGRPAWRPPIPERRPIPPLPRRRILAGPEERTAPAPDPAPSAGLAPTAPRTESRTTPRGTPMVVSVSTAPVLWPRPIPVTANAALVQQVGARSTAPAPSPSEKLVGANVDVEATADMISALPNGDGFRMVFAGDHTALSDNGERLLDVLVARMESQTDLRLSVLAYAGGTPETASRSRLLSLERALAVRNYLSDRGVRGSRIDLRAMGNTYVDGPPERVDLLLTE